MKRQPRAAVVADETIAAAVMLVFFKQGRQMGSFCKYSFLTSVSMWHNPEGTKPPPIGVGSRLCEVATEGPVGFESGSFCLGHSELTPVATALCARSHRLRLVLALFRAIRSIPVAAPIPARGAGAAFIYTPITSRARGGRMIAERSSRNWRLETGN